MLFLHNDYDFLYVDDIFPVDSAASSTMLWRSSPNQSHICWRWIRRLPVRPSELGF